MSSTLPPREHRSHHPEPRLRQGAHRAGRSVVGALMPSALAVAAVAALITALAVWQGEPPDQPRAAASTTRESTGGPAEDPTSTPPPATAASTPAEQATTAEETPSEPAEAASDMEVVVLNQTTRAGLAGEVAETLRGAGWTVPAVGNFRGVVPATTVYYPDGAEADALAAAADLPTEPRVRPRFGNLSTTRLTVVVTDSYPG